MFGKVKRLKQELKNREDVYGVLFNELWLQTVKRKDAETKLNRAIKIICSGCPIYDLHGMMIYKRCDYEECPIYCNLILGRDEKADK